MSFGGGGVSGLIVETSCSHEKTTLLVASRFDPDGLNMVIPQQNEDIFTIDRLRSRMNTAEEKWPRIMGGRKILHWMRN